MTDLGAPATAATLDQPSLLALKQAVVDQHGPWGSHNVALPHGCFTIGPEPKGDNHRVLKFLQLASDHFRRPLAGLKVLDLGCGEGLYALEFAQQGCDVVGVEGRDAHLAKAEFAKRALNLKNVQFIKDDVRHVNAERYGRFDLIICSGILYHLDYPDAFEFLKSIFEMCTGVCLIDTRIVLKSDIEVDFDGRRYGGGVYREHAPGMSAEEKLKDPGASLDNDQSFWFTRLSLANLLADIGFSSVSECLIPVPLVIRDDRITLVAVAGRSQHPFNELDPELATRRWP